MEAELRGEVPGGARMPRQLHRQQAVALVVMSPARAVSGVTGLPIKADSGLQPLRWGQQGNANGESWTWLRR